MNLDAVAIISGGMDSITLLHNLVKNKKLTVAPITFIYGQKHNKEVEYAKEQALLLGCTQHLVLDLLLLQPLFAKSALIAEEIDIPDAIEVMGDPQPPTYVPNRNMIFLALAAAYAETCDVSDVYYGAQRHDIYGYWDTTPQFLERLNQVYALNRKTPIQIKAPYIDYSKTDILKQGLELEVDYSKTWSCYKGGELSCGRCPTCAERLKAFADLNISDPLVYTPK
ncbi:MAG: 7-cyano-7-deazaguanine synthase QueC [Methylococcales bacterium]|nr:7-cyano-7-deazaguanine synthase QueC [Methylococcales bacterium]